MVVPRDPGVTFGLAQNFLFCHDEASLREIAYQAGIAQPTAYTEPWGGRERLFLRFDKQPKAATSQSAARC